MENSLLYSNGDGNARNWTDIAGTSKKNEKQRDKISVFPPGSIDDGSTGQWTDVSGCNKEEVHDSEFAHYSIDDGSAAHWTHMSGTNKKKETHQANIPVKLLDAGKKD